MTLFSNVAAIFFSIIISTLSFVVYAGVPPTSCIATAETENELSLSYWAKKEASMLMCSHGYWAEKCGAHKTAHIIFDRCIEAGYVGAMIWKSLLYENGTGVPQDSAKATELMRRAALSDNKDYATLGKLHYATSLYLGRGTERNVDEAMKWFREAADEGDADAMEFLRTGTHAADRDVKGRSVALQYEAKKLGDAKIPLAQHLIPVANDVAVDNEPTMANKGRTWSLIALLLLIVIGAFYQTIKPRKSLNKGA
ncbi:MAG: hypothetical protein COB45_12505 [Gammaproteobacteria bacterium]|nr:MAG: hypothetical protein COB45_12505 [Gammaproteobacteria bacterium]PHR84489.1 MAG: hypothetical protein COA59_05915 [Colwellia sp.]